MKKFMKMGISLCIMTSICFSGALPAYAAAPHRYFVERVENFLNDSEELVEFDIVIPKYIGSFTAQLHHPTPSEDRLVTNAKLSDLYKYGRVAYTEDVKIAVVRANPVSGKDITIDPIPEIKDSIIQYKRVLFGQTLDTIEESMDSFSFVLPYDADENKARTNKGRTRGGQGIKAYICEQSNYLIPVDGPIRFENEHGDNSIGMTYIWDGNLEPGFDYILPLTEEDEAYFLETGKFNVEDWGWSKIDWSGLRTVLTNPEAAPPVDISLNDKAVTYQAKPFTSTIRMLRLNDKEVTFQAYHIQGNPCYSLRDILAAMNGLPNQANITVDPETNKIEIFRGQPYTPTGKEFQAGDGTVKTAEAKRVFISKDLILEDFGVYKSGEHREGYLIDGEYYFDFYDLQAIVGFRSFKGIYKGMAPLPGAEGNPGKPDDMLQIY